MEPVKRLLEEIAEEVRQTADWTGRDRLDDRVMKAMAEVAREEFVTAGERRLAYVNAPLPIGWGQTISQPYIVALMSDLLALKGDETVLEVGTGSGYQTAVLSKLAAKVFTIERVPELSGLAEERLKRLGYDNVKLRTGDGSKGWPEEAPFDGIIVTAAAARIPEELIRQLKEGGRMVIPVGGAFGAQMLILVEKGQDGRILERPLLPVAFVPLIEDD